MSPNIKVRTITAALANTIWNSGDLLGLKVEVSLTLEPRGVYITEEIIIESIISLCFQILQVF